MFKTRFISMLVLLMTAVTGAWADTTVTWEGTKLQSIAVCKGYVTEDPMPESMTVDGITITANNGFLTNDQLEGVKFLSGAANGVVFSAENNIKSITITSTGFSQFTPDGDFQFEGGSHTYEVSPAATSYGFPTDVSINGITKIEITLEGAPTVAVTGVTLAPTSATLTLGETETVTLIPTVLPGDATDKSVTWSSSNEAVATVTNGVVTAVAAGTATITATATNGTADTSDDFSATCEVTVSTATYSVSLKSVTEDATSWQGKAGTGDYQELPLTGLEAGTAVSVKYSGTKKVKSVKAVKKAKPAATVTTAPTAKTGVKAGEDVAIVNEGTAEGGTMMYMVNATQPASTEGFSATVPTAEGLTAGTYYVWYYVKADDSHTDSEISATGIEVTIAAAEITVTWNSTNVFNDSHQGDYLYRDNTTPLTYVDITISFTGTHGGSGFRPYNNQGKATLVCQGGSGDSFTFTAPTGKKFTKIEIINNSFILFTAHGGWTKPEDTKIVWSGTAANTVTLGGSAITSANNLNSIVFTLE